jgi:outer membrane receptor protein involved in Fe transport
MAAAFAQSEAGGATLNGTVTDPSGAQVANAKVTAVNKSTGYTRTATTTESGLYSLVRLPAGRYDVTVEFAGFKPAQRTDAQLSIGAVATLDVQMEIGSAQETVNVTAELPVVESTRSHTSSVVNEKAVADLPVNGRNFLDFALLTPGVARDPRGGDLSFGGQRGTANSLLVDGTDSNNIFFGQASGRAGVRNPYAFSQDSVQEFQVSTNGYGAEIGRAGGGVVNVITKSGSNEIHGAAFEFYRDRAMNANTFINNSRSIRKPPYHFHQFGGNVGGPVKKDKVFFFADFDGQRNKNPNTVFLAIAPPADALSQQALQEVQKYLTSYTTNLENNVFLGKVDWNIDSNQRLSVRYNANRFTGKNFENFGASSAAEHTGNSKVNTNNVTGAYTRVIGAALLYETRAVFLKDDEPGEANTAAPEVILRQNNTTVLQFGRNNFSPRYTNSQRFQTVHSVSYVKGSHSYKAGADFNFERIDNFFPGNFSGSYSFNSYADFAARRPFNFTQAFAGAGTSGPLTQPNINEYAFFAQDAWRASERLTLNYGVRYDFMDSASPKVTNPNAALLAAGLNTGKMNKDTNNFAGRFGFAYKLREGMALRGGFGTFYARTPAIMTGTAHSNNGLQVQTFILTANLPAYPAILASPPAGGITPNIFVFAPDYVQPQTHQWSLNLEKQIGRDYGLTVGYLGVRGVHLSRTRDVNLFPAEPTAGSFADGTPVTFFRHPAGRPNPAFGRISVNESGADSAYHGGFIQLTKRFSKNFQVMSSYTFSKVIDTAPDQTLVVAGTDDAKGTQNSLLPNLDRALGDADVRHRFVLSGVWELAYAKSLSNPVLKGLLRDFQISTIATVQTGRHFNATVGGDPNNNGQTPTDRPPFLGRNTIEGPGFAAVDLRVSRDIPILGERLKFRGIFEAFNLTNRANFNVFNRGQYNYTAATRVFAPVTNFLVRTGNSDPRILQLAAKIIF